MMNLDEQTLNEYPWLLFKLYGLTYAVSSKCITAITDLPKNITVVPDNERTVRGIMGFRGKHIKLIDMRELFNLRSLQAEHDDFILMLDERKSDHIKWVDELERCVREHDHFTLATDPHKCKFGKWYYAFESKNYAISAHIKTIEDPHAKFHMISKEITDAHNEIGDESERDVAIKEIFERGRNEYMSQILEILEGAKSLFDDDINEMVVVFEIGDECFGVVIDEVLSVDEIALLNSANTHDSVFKNKYVSGIARSIKTKDIVLLLDYAKLLEIDG